MRLELDARARRLLRRLPRTNPYSLAEIVLLAVLAWQCAALIWAILTPVDPLGRWKPVAPSGPALPGAVLRGFDPFFRLQQQAGPATVTSLQLKLFGTRIDEANGGGSAIIAAADGIQKSFAVGEEVAPGVRLKAVAFDHVSLDRGGASEDLFLDQSSGAPAPAPADGAPAPGGAATPPSPAPAAGGSSIAQLRGEVGAIPRIDGGRVSGLVVRPQGSGAAFRRAGLREGDVITAIGGRPVTGPGDLDRIGTEFAGGGTLSVTVERGNQTLPLAITITGQ
ncbi:type II secretion system protein N [Sphingomonas aracearum]|uniref:PDZ domain-containing protein n=1 Tax=Sphingomonas aracearum TaxID=2283317 RepID=A0A369VRZ3_9SPHN|nr:type II secretion system protein N [Sphingomonas aracearum]RDE05156.1 PDZ domain-containing protein [Sphingomonas aracearum]